MIPQQKLPPGAVAVDDEGMPLPPGAELVDDSSSNSLDLSKLTANPKGQGTYRMVPPVGSDVTDKGIMIPYGNVQAARKEGFDFDPHNGDDARYAHDLFTELNNKGKQSSLNADDEDLISRYGVVPTPAPWSKEWLKRGAIKESKSLIDTLPTLGAWIGGASVGVPGAATGPGDIAIAGGGAYAGASIGEAASQFLNRELFGEELTPKQSAENIALQGGLGVLQEVGGRIVTIPLAKGAAYLGLAADESSKAGIRLLPSEAAGKSPSWIERFLKGSVLTSGQMERFRALQNTETKNAVDKLAQSISSFDGSPEDLGRLVQDGIDAHTVEFRKTQGALYDAIDKATEEKTVNVPTAVRRRTPFFDANGKPIITTQTVMTPKLQGPAMPSMAGLKDFATKELKSIEAEKKILDPTLLSQSEGLLQNIIKAPDHVTFRGMRDARSSMLSAARQLDEALPGKRAGLAKKLANLADEAMMNAAQKSGIPNLPDMLRNANALTAEEHRMFEQSLVKKIVETKKPEAIATLLRGNNVGLQETKDLFSVLPTKFHDPVRRQFLQDALRQSIDPKSEVLNEARFANLIDKIGDERGKVIFGSNWNNIKELTEILGRINGPVGLGAGGGASLQNIGIVKRIADVGMNIPADVAGYLTTAGIALGKGKPLDAVYSLAGEMASYKTIAWAMVNPRAATKMLTVARYLVKNLPYLASGVYQQGKDFGSLNSANSYFDKHMKSAKDIMNMYKNPSTPKPQAYLHHAVNPQTGKRIASPDGSTWFDIATGQQVA